MRILFFKSELAWPRSSGHDVHTYHMMRALGELGHEIALATLDEPAQEAIEGLKLFQRTSLRRRPTENPAPVGTLTWTQERFRSYWGVEPEHIQCLADDMQRADAQVLVVVGLEVLPYLSAAPGACRIWYAADEWFLHHATLIHPTFPSTWRSIVPAGIKLAYERAYAPLVDRAWVVSDRDCSAMRWLAGVRKVDVLPNGVDTQHYERPDAEPIENSCVFWGRLDFEPNIQGLQWFCQHVWPQIRAQTRDARLSIYGFNPTQKIRALATLPGVSVTPDLPDLRREIVRHDVAILPFISGAGIKNKILEAASLSMPILCTHRACLGLRGTDFPFVATDEPAAWVQELQAFWRDTERRRLLGQRAREWVLTTHTWEAAARDAAAGITESLTQSPALRPSHSAGKES